MKKLPFKAGEVGDCWWCGGPVSFSNGRYTHMLGALHNGKCTEKTEAFLDKNKGKRTLERWTN